MEKPLSKCQRAVLLMREHGIPLGQAAQIIGVSKTGVSVSVGYQEFKRERKELLEQLKKEAT